MSGDGSFQKVKAGTIALGNWTPLLAAVSLGSPELIKTLLDAGADINAPDVRGMTPLMLAVATDRQNIDVIRMLIARGADVNVEEPGGGDGARLGRQDGPKPAMTRSRRAGGVETAHAPAAGSTPPRTPTQDRGRAQPGAARAKPSEVSAANGGCASCHSHNIVDTVEHVARRERAERSTRS